MRCDKCHGTGWRDYSMGVPCFYCLGGEANCCDGEVCDALRSGNAQMEGGEASQRLEGGASGEVTTASGGDHVE